jgi:YHS domain-containing protein
MSTMVMRKGIASLKPVLALGAFFGVSIGAMLWLNKVGENHTPTSSGAPMPTAEGHVETKVHSANIQSFGNNHVEAALSDSGKLTIHFYGTEEKQLEPMDTAIPPEASLLPTGEDPVPLELSPAPYPGEPEGMSSRFVAETDRRIGSVGLTLTIPYQGKTYRVQWRPENLPPGAVEGGEASMPQAVGSDEARKLFLTPGGKYTQADIEANGKTTATAKYGSKMSMHNAHPKPGDSLCPISETVANPKFAWIVGGKTYTFCCPPCIEEFVKKAKETPDQIKSPESYVKS